MNRKIYYWKLRSVELQLGEKTLIMGILNVTPDSFSDGGSYSDPDRAYARALELEEQGVDIIDIGGESTRPGSQRVSAEEEWRRLIPVLKRLRDKLTVPLSLDTYKAEIAERAFEYGIEIVNDPSGLTFDADLARTVANANAGLILNHMRGTPETWAKLPPLPDMMGSVTRDLEATINRARRAGVDRNRIAIDPGLGFGKRREQNSEILAHLRQLAALDYPILTGPSRKSFLAQSTEPETLYATAAAVAISIMNGAHIVRVHDVKEMRAVVQIADDVVRAADVKQAAQIAAQAAERPVPRRNAREMDDRPRSVTPPVARPPVVPTVVPPAAMPEPAEKVDMEMAPEASAPTVTETTGDAPREEERPAPREKERRAPQRETKKSDGYNDARKAGYNDARKDGYNKEARPAARPYADRPPRRDFGTSKPPARGDRPPARRDSGDRPPRRDFSDRPPRRDFGSRPPSGDRPPKREYPDRAASGSRPPRRDFAGSRPSGGDRPPRRDFAGSRPSGGDRPPRRDFGGRPPTGDRPPRRDYGGSGKPPGGDRPPRRDFTGARPTGGGRPPRRDFGDRPPRRDSGPPRSKGPEEGGSKRPPSRPFRKRP